MGERLNWYLAEMIFRLHNANRVSEHRFDKYFLPISASSEKSAYQMALIAASNELEKRKDYTKDYLEWEFVGMESLTQIEKSRPENAYSNRITVPEDIDRFVYSLKIQNENIQSRLTDYL